MWKDYLSGISKECNFIEAAKEDSILSIREQLNMTLPKDLLELYKETNGVYGIAFIWCVEQMLKENVSIRLIYKDMDSLISLDNYLFFSDAGNGDLFCYSNVNDGTIYVWNHEDQRCKGVASSLEEFLNGWITGVISI